QDKRDRLIGNINANPLAFKLLCDNYHSATPAISVKDNITFMAAGLNDTLKECLWFLRRVPKPFFRLAINRRNICPYTAQWNTRRFIQITDFSGNSSRSWLGYSSFSNLLFHVGPTITPVLRDTEDFIVRISFCRSPRPGYIP